jgi:hypothetical protein
VSEQPVWVTVSAHVHVATPVMVRLHPEDARVVVVVGDNSGWPRVDLYLSRPVLAAFRDTLTIALADLDVAIHTLTETTNAGNSAGSTDGSDGSETVRNSAA